MYKRANWLLLVLLLIGVLLISTGALAQHTASVPDTLSADDLTTFMRQHPEARVVSDAAQANVVVRLHKETFYQITKSNNDASTSTTALRQVADFLRTFTTASVSVTGYADRGTGNYELNQMYANRRATQFSEDLKRWYGIEPYRITATSNGDVVQPFSQNDRNRCVIVDGTGYLSLSAQDATHATANELAEAQRRDYRSQRDARYNEERARHRPRTRDTIYVTRVDTLWAQPDTLRPERAFGLNKEHRNWFITVSGGPAIFQGDHNIDAVWKDRIYPAFDLAIGKWIYPALGIRGGVNLDMVHSYYNANPDYPNDLAAYYGEFVHGASPNEPYAERPWLYRMDYNAWNFHADILVNFSSLMWKPYNRRFWNLIGYAGVGCIATWDHGSPQWHNQDWFNYATSWNVGILNSFRVSEHFDINLDLRLKKFSDDFNCFRQGHRTDGMVNLMIGGTWHFTKRGF